MISIRVGWFLCLFNHNFSVIRLLKILGIVLICWSVLLFSPVLNLIISAFHEFVPEVAHDFLSAFVHYLPPNLLERITINL